MVRRGQPELRVTREGRRSAQHPRSALFVLALATACRFDPSGLAPGGGPDQPDAGSDPGSDAGVQPDCPEDLHTELSVNGQPVGDEPVATVLVGDTVRLSAEGSCSRGPGLRYLWQIEDPDLAATIDPNDRREEITVFPSLPGDFRVTLTVSDDAGSDEPVSAVAIRAIGWTVFQNGQEVRDLAVGAGRVWIASPGGPRVLDLDDLDAVPRDLNELNSGDDIGGDLGSVLFSPASGLVWFGQRGTGTVWRVNASTLAAQRILLPAGGVLGVRDIAGQGAGVIVTGLGGAATSTDNQTFTQAVATGEFFAAASNQDAGWIGGQNLLQLGTITPTTFDVFDRNDNEIRTLAGDDDRLWIGTDGNGIARFFLDGVTGKSEIFTRNEDGLPSDNIHGLAVDLDHDVWAATDDGVARYKRDRGVWISLDEEAGLTGSTNLAAVAVSAESPRLIVVGDSDGIAVLRVP